MLCRKRSISVVLGASCSKDSRFQEAEGLTFTGEAVTEPTSLSGPIDPLFRVGAFCKD